jgi:two-component system NtrC family sensor kinase
MKVLIVDDNANDRKLLRLNLESHGCDTVIEARDGQEGLELARAHRPDLIISDALMPHMDGFQFLHLIKSDEELRAIPFVFHSSVYTGLKDEELASNLGAEAFIPKPKEPEEFWTELAGTLERVATGTKKPPPSEPMEEEKEYLRKYSGVVAAKLEEKVRDLEENLARRKEAEEALRKSEQFLNNIIENIPDMIFVKDARELRFILFNRAGEELLGYSREELAGKNDDDVFAPHEAEFFTGKDREVISNGSLVDIPEETIRTRNKGTRVLHTKKIPIPDEAGNPQYLLGISEDITERKQAEEELLILSSAIEQSPAAIVITDAKGNIEFVNPKFTQITGYLPDEVRGSNPRILKSGKTPPEEYKRLWDTISSGMVWHGEFLNKNKNGELFWECATISPVKNQQGVITHYIAIKEDITDRKKLEEQLRHAQKMEAVGTMAGGIAHDFNNILTVIIGFGSILERKMAKGDPLRTHMSQILSAADRAANLTRSLLTFGRSKPIAMKQADLNQIVKGIDKMLRRLIREDIELRLNLAQGDLAMMADTGQIEQVLMNLVTNAQDAMPGGGIISITTGMATMDEEFRRVHGYGDPGDYALLVFADTGMGIEESVRERIFEPFFTTKDVGKGTGLGLSVCYGIIKLHGGYINCYSEPGRGTTFRIFIPLVRARVEKEKANEAVPLSGGIETILVAEDDVSVRDFTTSILREFGYTVIEARDGEEAVAKFVEHQGSIRLCLLDAIMPKSNGWEAYNKIRHILPGAKAVFMSGYPPEIFHKEGEWIEGADFIAKPILPHELLRKVREALDG